MGWWTKLKRGAGDALEWTADNAGELARAGVSATAGAVGTGFCGPACGAAAALLTDRAVGGVVERNVRRGVGYPGRAGGGGGGDDTPDVIGELAGDSRDVYEVQGAARGINELVGDAQGGRRRYGGALVAAGAGLAAVAVAATVARRSR